MKNDPCLGDFPMKASIHRGFSIAMCFSITKGYTCMSTYANTNCQKIPACSPFQPGDDFGNLVVLVWVCECLGRHGELWPMSKLSGSQLSTRDQSMKIRMELQPKYAETKWFTHTEVRRCWVNWVNCYTKYRQILTIIPVTPQWGC